MALTASGLLQCIAVRTQYLVAASTNFQSLVGVSSAEKARDRVHIFEAIDYEDDNGEITHKWPRAIVEHSRSAYSSNLIATGTYAHTGVIEISLGLEVPRTESRDKKREQYWAANKVGDIVGDMQTLVSTRSDTDAYPGETHLEVLEWMIGAPEDIPAEEEEQPDYGILPARWFCDIDLHWGVPG